MRWFEGWLAENAPDAKTVLRMEYKGLLIAHAIRAGIGAQILPCFLADPDPLLRRIAPLDETFRLDLWLLTLPELRTNSRFRAVNPLAISSWTKPWAGHILSAMQTRHAKLRHREPA